MKLYIDNYKGFVDTFIDFKRVNFFVGDNSSGKTSIMQLLNTLQNHRFWFDASLNTKENQLGSFSEIVNKCMGKKKYFILSGDFSDDNPKDKETCYFWLKFKEKNYSPYVSEFRFINGNKSIWCILKTETKTTVYTKQIPENISFHDWVKDDEDYMEYRDSITLPRKAPYGVLRSITREYVASGDLQTRKGRLIVPDIGSEMFYIAPIRAAAHKWYESYQLSYSSMGEHTPLLLKKLLSDNSQKARTIIAELNKYGKESGLFDELVIEGENEEKPFSIEVKYDNMRLNLKNVGYGVSQVLPIIMEMLTSKGEYFCVQQPEVHLHPRAQAALGDFMFKIASEYRNTLFLETHSNYMINRFRIATSKSAKSMESQILFFKRTKRGTVIETIPIDKTGQLIGDYVDDYMSFYIEEEMNMLCM